MGWPSVMLGALGFAGESWASDTAIPYRQEEAGLGMQVGLAYGSVVLLLALAVAGMFMLRKRLGARLPGALAASAGLRCVASLRLPSHTLVHVVAYRDREFLFAHSGDKLVQLGQFKRNVDHPDGGA